MRHHARSAISWEMMKVRGLGSKLKTKAAGRKNKLAMRQIFVGYAEAFG